MQPACRSTIASTFESPTTSTLPMPVRPSSPCAPRPTLLEGVGGHNPRIAADLASDCLVAIARRRLLPARVAEYVRDVPQTIGFQGDGNLYTTLEVGAERL